MGGEEGPSTLVEESEEPELSPEGEKRLFPPGRKKEQPL